MSSHPDYLRFSLFFVKETYFYQPFEQAVFLLITFDVYIINY
jgi:hypothetical protein